LKQYGDRVVTIFRQQIQPWHPSSTLVHEAGYAVQKVDSSKFYEFSASLFDHQKDFFDVNVVNETRNATYKRLAKIAGSVGVDEKKVYELLEISDKAGEDGSLNTGNKVTDDVKIQVKANRLTGVHVTPTVVFDGVIDNDISSGWTIEQWEEWLVKNVK
jgi:predicted DsbA family dithiol-disulfide isomerase